MSQKAGFSQVMSSLLSSGCAMTSCHRVIDYRHEALEGASNVSRKTPHENLDSSSIVPFWSSARRYLSHNDTRASLHPLLPAPPPLTAPADQRFPSLHGAQSCAL